MKPRQFGPTHVTPSCAARSVISCCRRSALDPDLVEARGQHDREADPRGRDVAQRIGDGLGADQQEGEVDRLARSRCTR